MATSVPRPGLAAKRPSRWSVLLSSLEIERMGDLELHTPRTWEIELSGPTLALLGAAVAAAASALLIVVTFCAWQSVQAARGWLAERRLRHLAAEVTRLDWRTAAFADSVAALTAREDMARRMAGLGPLDLGTAVRGTEEPGDPSGGGRALDRSWGEGGPLARTLAGVNARVDQLTRVAALYAASVREVTDSASAYAKEQAAMPSIMPTAGFISSGFAAVRDHPILHEDLPHLGLDIAAPYGSRVLAPAAGRVLAVARESGYGLMVVLDHGYGIETVYAHLSSTVAHPGEVVKRGDPIGFVGTSGLSTGPHLHYEVRINGRPVNPREFVVPDAFSRIHKAISQHKKNPRLVALRPGGGALRAVRRP